MKFGLINIIKKYIKPTDINNKPLCKKVKIKIEWQTFGDPIIEIDELDVPIGLTDTEEKEFIDKFVSDKYDFLYGY